MESLAQINSRQEESKSLSGNVNAATYYKYLNESKKY
jgi:hypothetical protein